jgi:hypothetical protein
MSSSSIQIERARAQHVTVTDESLVVELTDGPSLHLLPGIRGFYTATRRNGTIGTLSAAAKGFAGPHWMRT